MKNHSHRTIFLTLCNLAHTFHVVISSYKPEVEWILCIYRSQCGTQISSLAALWRREGDGKSSEVGASWYEPTRVAWGKEDPWAKVLHHNSKPQTHHIINPWGSASGSAHTCAQSPYPWEPFCVGSMETSGEKRLRRPGCLLSPYS